ncbi:MAG: GTP 3',8-cyclase MoaA [Thermodesulfobacteriaceae bacterium]|nr:GTP 3',8-cyclase MoaA [Thermodesulfobacteriaceae bacterium]MDW8136712.1 GTP 3',8-cyclase MoaA [Thermodesulfobacterium sp.]
MLIDSYGRTIEYLRISVTDRCNFKCIYCQSQRPWKQLPPKEILSFEEIEEIVKVSSQLGVKRIRLTGGEPLLRKNIEILVEKLAKIPGIEDLSLTTNGFFLEEKALILKKVGLKRINISLDTLEREKFKKITGKDELNRILRGIEVALEVGFNPVKINVVVIRGFNHEEIIDLAKLTLEKPLEVRFIEFMPLGKNSLWNESKVFYVTEIRKILESFKKLEPVFSVGGGPAKSYKWKGSLGKIGLISPISEHICRYCNRMRITADGKLRPCLFSDFEIDLKAILRKRKGSLREAFKLALKMKPEKGEQNSTIKPMKLIGG